jgi:hypothetical protein
MCEPYGGTGPRADCAAKKKKKKFLITNISAVFFNLKVRKPEKPLTIALMYVYVP